MKKQPNLKQNNPEVTTEQRFTCSQLTIGKVEKKSKICSNLTTKTPE